MKLTATLAAIMLGLAAFTAPGMADEKVQHYEAKPSETLEQAVKNFSEYNKKLSEVLGRESLSDSDMEEVHQLTYTLEVALAKINEEMSGIVDTLEEVHLASEERNEAKLRGVAEVYMEVATTVVP
jgi:type III secretory pathway lipoprotein EscJ